MTVIKPRDPFSLDDEAIEEASGLQPVHEVWDEVYALMRRAFGARDYARAVDLGDRFLERNPEHAAARLFVQECRTILEGRLAKELAPLDRIVSLLVPLHPLMSADLDHRAGFLLSRVDGLTTIEDLIDLAGMPRADAMRIILDCVERGLIGFG